MAESTLNDLHSPDWRSSDGGFQLLHILTYLEAQLVYTVTLHAQRARTDIHPDHIELAVLRAVCPGRAMEHGPNASDACIGAVRELLVMPDTRQNALQWLGQSQRPSREVCPACASAPSPFCCPLYACIKARVEHVLATM